MAVAISPRMANTIAVVTSETQLARNNLGLSMSRISPAAELKPAYSTRSRLPPARKPTCGLRALPVFQPYVLELDLHRWADVHLHTDQPVDRTVGRIVIDHDGHDATVDDVCED